MRGDVGNLLTDVSPEHEFKVADGRNLKNLRDLVNALPVMNEEVFIHHVNEERNDFASWVQFVFQDEKLAKKIDSAKEKEKMFSILGKALQPKQKKTVKKKAASIPESLVKKSSPKKERQKAKKSPVQKSSSRKVKQKHSNDLDTKLPKKEVEALVLPVKKEVILEVPGKHQHTSKKEGEPKPLVVGIKKKPLARKEKGMAKTEKEVVSSGGGPSLVMQKEMPRIVEKKTQPQTVTQDNLFSMDPILNRVDKMTQVVESIEKEHDSIVQNYLKDMESIPKEVKEELRQEKEKKSDLKKTAKPEKLEELAKPIRKPKVKGPEVKIIRHSKELPKTLPDLKEAESPVKIKVKKPEKAKIVKEKQEKVEEETVKVKPSRKSFLKLRRKKTTTPAVKELSPKPARSIFKLKVKKAKEELVNQKEKEILKPAIEIPLKEPEMSTAGEDIKKGKEAEIPEEKKEIPEKIPETKPKKSFFRRMFRKREKIPKKQSSEPKKRRGWLFKKDKLIKAEDKGTITATLSAQTQLPNSVDTSEKESGWDCKRMNNNILRIEDVAIHYGKNIILKDISFIVNKGDMVAIVGGSGVGKTSLLNALIGHTPLMHGSISYYFPKEKRLIPVTGKSLPFKHKFGFAAQFPSIYPELTVNENLKYFSGLYDLPSAVKKENIKNALKLVGLVGDENKPAKKLSGGMKKRLDIACSIVHNPEVLILDEPTADVDPVLRNQIWNVLEDINNTGTTIVVASHHLTEVESMCNKVLFLREKSMEYYGDPAGFREKYATTREVEVTLDEEEYDEAVKKLTGMSFLEIKEQYRKKGKIIMHSRKSEKMINKALLRALGKSSNIKIHDPSMDMLFKVFAEK